jgi:hypothetical protein
VFAFWFPFGQRLQKVLKPSFRVIFKERRRFFVDKSDNLRAFDPLVTFPTGKWSRSQDEIDFLTLSLTSYIFGSYLS